eukprot:TRINITY_DN50506_c0_g1_i1.p1 TRINITY_DN50506_c0_g1~~TRINITY_DN50506_c0_g1_i1.p1  ORF type:complete len:294 (+),score=24.99 TRINITY_DN50506_c0_g1_i1:86-967(+)
MVMVFCGDHGEDSSAKSESEEETAGSESEEETSCAPSIFNMWQCQSSDAAPERRTRGLKSTGKHFPFRAIPLDRINKKSIRSPLLYFTKEGTDEPGDGSDPFVRTLEGKREDYELSEEVGKHAVFSFFSHTRTDTHVGDTLDKKIARLLKDVKRMKQSGKYTHLWVDGACFDQALICEGGGDVQFEDLRHVIDKCHGLNSDTHGDYEEKPWCIVELEIWDHVKGHRSEWRNKLLHDGYKAIAKALNHDAKKHHKRSKRATAQLKAIVNDARDYGMHSLPSRIEKAMKRAGVDW